MILPKQLRNWQKTGPTFPWGPKLDVCTVVSRTVSRSVRQQMERSFQISTFSSCIFCCRLELVHRRNVRLLPRHRARGRHRLVPPLLRPQGELGTLVEAPEEYPATGKPTRRRPVDQEQMSAVLYRVQPGRLCGVRMRRPAQYQVRQQAAAIIRPPNWNRPRPAFPASRVVQ